MCDLGASINVLPLSVYQKLSGAKMVDTKVVIQLVDRSCIHPDGVLENVIVKIHNYLYPADFHVIKMAEPTSAGSGRVLLGRPFLRTAKTIIDVSDGTICLDYHGEKYTFSIDEAMKKPMDVENLHSIDVIAPLVQEYLEEELLQEKFEEGSGNKDLEKEVAGWCQEVRTQGCWVRQTTRTGKGEEASGSDEVNEKKMERNPLPSEASPEKKELKKLPPGLKYSYLGTNESLPVIISSKLTKGQEERLLEVLRKNQKAIG
ncbi:hypothetical protein AAHA92_01347 [Salvia divinorum]|uniref:Uncharacterized protein n=1 Tax=Salvia divinorum TaxID=28513 RepID=A0ABD1IPX9_SALDI